MSNLPPKMLERVLLRAFVMLYASDFGRDNDRSPHKSGKSKRAERRAFTLLSSVCWYWHQTVIGGPQSHTFGVRLKRLIGRKYFLPARRYATARVFAITTCLDVDVRPSVRPTHAGIVPSRAKAGS